VVVRIGKPVQNFIAIPAELGLAQATEHFVAPINFLNLKSTLFVRADLRALLHKQEVFALIND
jgi:hypothetical protein